MPRPRKRFLHREVSRHGTVTWYFRRGHEPRIRMHGEFGSPEFDATYRAAFVGEPVPAVKASAARRKGRRSISPNVAIIPKELIGDADENPSVVYFVRAEKRIKIGVTRNIRSRMMALQTGQAAKFELLFAIPGDRRLEDFFHRQFELEHVDREWFAMEGELKAFLEGRPYERVHDAKWTL